MNTTVFTFKTLFIFPHSPSDYLQTATCPTTLFLIFFINKKSLLKPVSLNFQQTLMQEGLQRILPTVFSVICLFFTQTESAARRIPFNFETFEYVGNPCPCRRF